MKKNIIKGAFISAVIGFAISFALNYWLIPVPENSWMNGLGAGICGCINAFIGSFTASLPKKESE